MKVAKVTNYHPQKNSGKMNINPGDKVTFFENEKGDLVIKLNKKSILRLAGILHRPNQEK